MKRWLFTTLFFLSLANFVWAQGYHHGRGHNGNWPDSLTTLTVTGTILIDASQVHPVYYLDTNADGQADYHLAFGPYWYQPTSGAKWPEAGQTVTIVGALNDFMTPPSIIVFELDGLKWREPVEFGMFGWNGHDPWEAHGDTLTVTGVVLADTTYFYTHYYLDTDNDRLPEYQLGFGPPWYVPEKGVSRPAPGETVTIFGRLHDENMAGVPMLMVYSINGVQWQNPFGPAPWAGSWMHRDRDDSARVFCVNDSSNWIQFPPGNMGRRHGMGMGMWPDSVFVQFWRIHPDSLPGPHQNGRFAAFYINVQDPAGQSMMGQRMGGRRGHMQFELAHRFHFQYSDEDLREMGLNEANVQVFSWDEEMAQWQALPGATIDTQTNTVSLTSNSLANYYALSTAEVTTAVTGPESGSLPSRFTLEQNYPNPFNPSTTIRFRLAQKSRVRLEIFNLLGQKVATLVDAVKPAGAYSIKWNGVDSQGRAVQSGTYLLRMQSNGQVSMRRMVFLK